MGEEAVGSLGLPRVWSTRPDQTTDLGGLQAATLLHSCFFFFSDFLPLLKSFHTDTHPPPYHSTVTLCEQPWRLCRPALA